MSTPKLRDALRDVVLGASPGASLAPIVVDQLHSEGREASKETPKLDRKESGDRLGRRDDEKTTSLGFVLFGPRELHILAKSKQVDRVAVDDLWMEVPCPGNLVTLEFIVPFGRRQEQIGPPKCRRSQFLLGCSLDSPNGPLFLGNEGIKSV